MEVLFTGTISIVAGYMEVLLADTISNVAGCMEVLLAGTISIVAGCMEVLLADTISIVVGCSYAGSLSRYNQWQGVPMQEVLAGTISGRMLPLLGWPQAKQFSTIQFSVVQYSIVLT